MDLEHRLSRVLSDFARTVATDFSIQEILDELVVRIVNVLPITAAGVTLISADTDPHFIAASDDSALRYEQLQTELGEGPCIATYESGEAVAVPNLRDETRFPRFAPRALEEGLSAVFTFPLRDGERRLGALDLYRTTVGPLNTEAMVAAQTLADVASAYLLNAQAREDLQTSSEAAQREQMKQLEKAHSDFISQISHELRSPLTTVIGYVEMLADGEPDAPSVEQQRMLAIIERNSRRLLDLIEELLVMSRLEAGSFAIEVAPIDVADVVERVREATAPTVAAAGLELAVDIRSHATVVGDAGQLERALLNFVSNAVKFTKTGGRIEIESRTSGDHLALSVRDTGIGIPTAEQPRLFTRFFRGVQSKQDQAAGTGLGLYIAKEIVERHGGHIEVASSSSGTTFTMFLPVAGAPADPPSTFFTHRLATSTSRS